jgi:hypothetical protein
MDLELTGFQSLGNTSEKTNIEGKVNYTHIFFLNNNKTIEVNTTTLTLQFDGSEIYKYIKNSELKDTYYGEKTIEPYTTTDIEVDEKEKNVCIQTINLIMDFSQKFGLETEGIEYISKLKIDEMIEDTDNEDFSECCDKCGEDREEECECECENGCEDHPDFCGC